MTVGATWWRPVWRISSWLAVLVGCGQEQAFVADPLPPPSTPVEPPSCVEACLDLQGCGAIDAAVACEGLCEKLDGEGAFAASCRTCMAEGCEAAVRCLADVNACGETKVQFNVAVSNLPVGARAYGRLSLWDGTEQPAFASAEVVEGGTAFLGFGYAVHAGVRYRVDYYVDERDDGRCDADDVAGSAEVFVDNPSLYVLQYASFEQNDDGICGGFEPRDTLCERRCAEARACEATDGDAECVTLCEAATVDATVACLQCMQDRSCQEQQSACRAPGGVCEREYVSPDASLLAGISSLFPNDVGTSVVGQVRNAGGRILATSAPVEVREDGGFVLTFGQTVWRGQTYRIEFFLDRNDNGACASEPAYGIDAEIGENIATLYVLANQENLEQISCADVLR